MKNFLYSAITVVSPMISNGELKDQDRARWHEPCQSACICDGVTTSPYSAKAAEYVTAFIPSIFSGNPVMHLEMLADILIKYRLEACSEQPIISKEKYSDNMRKMLKDIMLQNNTKSYQTTIIAARFSTGDNIVIADIIKCGDSGFFAFSDKGLPLSSSLQFNNQFSKEESNLKKQRIIFGPGNQILVRVEGRLSDYKKLLVKSGIKSRFAKNWLVCTPVDSCNGQKCLEDSNLFEIKPLHLSVKDRLLVPKYLYGKILTSQGKHYRALNFSSTIKAISSINSSQHNFAEKGSATHVLPDHFYSGDYDLVKDSFPLKTNFLLCSDGFYSAFDGFEEMFSWLNTNKKKLNDPHDQKDVLKQLHLKLSKKSGDDDISFIWVIPNKGDKTNVQ